MDAGDRAHRVMTAQSLTAAMSSVVPHRRARRLVTRAWRVAGIGRPRNEESLETIEWLMILEAIAAEGGELQMLAEVLARQALVGGSGSGARRP